MSEYSFEYESLSERIYQLELLVDRLKDEQIETDNTLYEILNRLDRIEGKGYDTDIFNGG
jgi:hypothetical protein